MRLQTDYRRGLASHLSRQRREMASVSPKRFAQIYLPHHFNKPMSRMHEELLIDLLNASADRPKRLAIAAPRGHAKTTLVSLAYVLWCAAYAKEMYILLISATKELSAGLLKNVKAELQTNSLMLQDFPEVCYPPGTKPAPKPWRDNQIVLRNGVAIKALGAGQGVRGTKHGPFRPTLIIIDDLEDQEQVNSSEQREKLRDWFEKTLLKCGDPSTNTIFVGTILHYDSLLACHVSPATAGNGTSKISGWQTRKYQAIEVWSNHPDLWEKWETIYTGQEAFQDESGPAAAEAFFQANKVLMLECAKALWPEREDYRQLMEMRIREGRYSFQSEKQNEPLDPKDCIFRVESFVYWDKQFGSPADVVASIGREARIYGACDPSLGKRGGQGDYTAIITILEDKRDKLLYVIGADIARRRPEQTIEKILEYAKLYHYKDFAVECNQFQELLYNQLKERARHAGVHLPLREITNTAHKQARIESLEPLISQGTLRFSRRHQLLIEQLRQFPIGANDDGPDALQVATEIARKPKYRVFIQRGI
ncbi:MAG: phage terminase large subunit [Acidobacteriales bacterium]|nr:phage terminase large subunit [Terriglobales bacterium]